MLSTLRLGRPRFFRTVNPIRSLARRLAEDGPTAKRLRATVNRTLSGRSPKKGGILAALRRSPLVGADLDVTRVVTRGRKIDL